MEIEINIGTFLLGKGMEYFEIRVLLTIERMIKSRSESIKEKGPYSFSSYHAIHILQMI